MSAHEIDLFEYVAIQARKIPENVFTKPDDDWTPVMFIECGDGECGMLPLEPFMGDDLSKEFCADVVMPTAIEVAKARKVVLVLSAWTAQVWCEEELEPIRYIPPSQRENREEVLVVMEYTSEGVARHAMAPIIRHDDSPPELGDWWDDESELSPTDFDGRFVQPIVNALKEVEI